MTLLNRKICFFFSLLFILQIFISSTVQIEAFSVLKILDCSPESEVNIAPTIFEPDENTLFANIQEVEGVNVSQVSVKIYPLESPRYLRQYSDWNVTWYRIEMYNDTTGIERAKFVEYLETQTWRGLNWTREWGLNKIIGNYSEMVGFQAECFLEIGSDNGVFIQTITKDGMRVYVEGKSLTKLDTWFPHDKIFVEDSIFLVKGFHKVQVNWFNKDGNGYSELRIFETGGSIHKTIHLSRGETNYDSEGNAVTTYSGLLTVPQEWGERFLLDWSLKAGGEIIDTKTTYLKKYYLPIDGYFTINNEVVENATVTVIGPFVEFWFYSTSRGAEIDSVFVEFTDITEGFSEAPLVLSEFEINRAWYGNYTFPKEGEIKVRGFFQCYREEEWVNLSTSIVYHSEVSPRLLHFLTNGIIIMLIVVGGYVLFSVGKQSRKKSQFQNTLVRK
jgi:hypothetical protein